MVEIAALIVAAGEGSRLGGERPKQYQMIAGKPLLWHTLRCFTVHPDVDSITVVIHPDHRAWAEEVLDMCVSLPGHPQGGSVSQKMERGPGSSLRFAREVVSIIYGGATRQESVYKGLETLEADAPDIVLIHDAARPNASVRLIDRVLAPLKQGAAKAVIPGVGVRDTLKKGEKGWVVDTVNREALYAVQTPQGFVFKDILAAHRSIAKKSKEGQQADPALSGVPLASKKTSQGTDEQYTDDAAVAEAADIPVMIVPGDSHNTKLTYPEDMEDMEQRLQAERITVTGQGYDVHRLIPGEGMMLCGVHVPCDLAIEAHSDGDVGLHALVDALLGAIGAGDIGEHFPPSDPRWKGADSGQFVTHALKMVQEAGGAVQHADVTLIAEQPKLSKHKVAMQARVADLLGLDKQRVNIKATTTEKLGAIGRGEGIAAMAVVTVALGQRY